MRVNLVMGARSGFLGPHAPHALRRLEFEPPEYAHTSQLMKRVPAASASCRSGTERTSTSYRRCQRGGALYYARLANGSLARCRSTTLAAPIRLPELGGAGPLIDQVKLEDSSADHIATLTGQQILGAMRDWAAEYDPELASVLASEEELALAALAVEREGVENPRKDLRKWSDFRSACGFFFPELFTPVQAGDERLGGLPDDLVRAFAADFVAGYQDLADRQEWFEQVRDLAAKHGFAQNRKQYKQAPEDYPGSINDAANLIRVALTGSTTSPDLATVAHVLGRDEVVRRVSALTA
jgi:glutamyl-tRNA synthetase